MSEEEKEVHDFPAYVLVRTHENVLVVDISKKMAVELVQVDFDMRPADSKRWCESMTVV
jgi:hypothetical protein